MRIEVRDLGYIYSEGMPFESVALEGVSFTVESGEFAAVIGHTGSGKSTLLMHLNGLMKPTHGRVLADGEGTAADGRFLISLPPQAAQAGCRLTFSDGRTTVTAEDVAIGEVYLAGGQSNMER